MYCFRKVLQLSLDILVHVSLFTYYTSLSCQVFKIELGYQGHWLGEICFSCIVHAVKFLLKLYPY